MTAKFQPDDRRPLGIVAAYRAEIASLLHRARSVRRAVKGAIGLDLPGGDAVLVISGAGAQNAVRATRWLIGNHALSGLISIGFAGGVAAGATRGVVLAASSVVDAVSGEQYTCAMRFQNQAGCLNGRLVTVPFVASSRAQKASLGERWQASAVDMEAAAVAREAAAASLPFGSFKAITDGPDDELAIDFQRCLTPNGGLSSVKIVREGLRGWQPFRSLVLLSQNSRAAAQSLAAVLVKLESVSDGTHLT
jgi:adenosylhomocysteine nucleosidase